MPDSTPVQAGLVASQLVKSYSGVTVLKSVDFTVPYGAVVGLIGENGAGKSTLSSILAGVKIPDSGSMTVDGLPYAPANPAEALANGVALIHQEIRLLPELSVAENIFLGRLPRKGGRVDRERMNAEAAEALRLLGTSTDPRRLVSGLSMAAQQEIEIAKAITRGPRYVIFDEPSASLGESETEKIFERIRVLRDQGAGVVYISHRLDEVREMADSIVCLRDGQRVADWSGGPVPKQQLVNAMVGRDFTYEHRPPKPNRDEVVLKVENLGRKNVFQDINFEVSAGEVFGIAGLVGAGRTEVVRCIAGIDRADEGSVSLDGTRLRLSNPSVAIKAGIVLVPEDRKGQGLNLDRTAAQNISLPWERSIGRTGLITGSKVAKLADEQAKSLDIRGRLELPVSSMSGGNQQKVLLGKWLVRKPRVFIVDEPTRGVDVGAKMAIYEILRELAADGVAVIVVSSELEEVLGLSHRVLVMSGGRQEGVLSRADATPQAVMRLAVRDIDLDEAVPEPAVSGTAGSPGKEA
jgi:ribose transport system ATP-binding protein